MTIYQTIWVVEFEPIPPHSVGGYDWYYSYDNAIKQFTSHMENDGLTSHQISIYSVQLPIDYTRNQIQTWTEDNCNVLPRHCDTLAPAQAGE